jgi:L-cysteine:1D-myo-inositol 2-amino-2-deoxy-alpha-D-glucopyranoside ligase
VRLWDTSAGRMTAGIGGETATMYVCGITPYDATHLGHAATYVAFDLVNRIWRDGGRQVRYVQNVTDIDDPLLERAAATGVDWRELADSQTQLFADHMADLRVLPPQVYLGAVETIPRVVEAVDELLATSHAYQLDGDVYFAVRSDPHFGSVARLDDAAMLALFAERGGDPDRPGKKDPLDPVLWRAARPGEPSWPGGDLGPGRPGWHIECTAIALSELGMPLDVQGGGSDLAFPHHEMGASHAHALTGRWPFAEVYAHSGMVGFDGHKMSKSRGNLVFVSQLMDGGVEPMTIRLALLAQHYRTDWEWTDKVLLEATARTERGRAAGRLERGTDAEGLLGQVRRRLADDLDAPGALAAVDAWVDRALSDGTATGDDTAPRGDTAPGDDRRKDADAGPRLMIDTVDALLGVDLRD